MTSFFTAYTFSQKIRMICRVLIVLCAIVVFPTISQAQQCGGSQQGSCPTPTTQCQMDGLPASCATSVCSGSPMINNGQCVQMCACTGMQLTGSSYSASYCLLNQGTNAWYCSDRYNGPKCAQGIGPPTTTTYIFQPTTGCTSGAGNPPNLPSNLDPSINSSLGASHAGKNWIGYLDYFPGVPPRDQCSHLWPDGSITSYVCSLFPPPPYPPEVDNGQFPTVGDITFNWTAGNALCYHTSADGLVTYSILCYALSTGGGNGSGFVGAIPPDAPTITGATTGYPNSGYVFSFLSNDPLGLQIRYGIDWNMDGVADQWLPAGNGYVQSGTSQSATYQWTTIGTKAFEALAQNSNGANSGWTIHTTTLVAPPAAPTITFTGNPLTGVAPLTSTLTWSSNGTSCVASGGSAGWTGSVGTSGTRSVTVSVYTTYILTCSNAVGNTIASVTLQPTAQQYNLNVTKTYGGSVRSADGFISCGTTCGHTYNSGTNVTLTPTPDSAQWKFVGWIGACSGSGGCTVTVNATKTVSALFILRPLIYQEF